ncbi:MAG: LytTR family DNA-binding domain-containing protein [Oscillospiraceae bacterium]
MLKIAVCDDNPEFLSSIVKMIEDNFKGEYTLTKHNNAFSLVDYIDFCLGGNVNIVITDIQMDVQNGISAAKEIKGKYPHIEFIFVTAYTEYIQDAFDVDPVYYIIKPVNPEDLIKALEKAVHIVEKSQKNVIVINCDGDLVGIKIDEIRYIKSDKRIVKIFENRETYEVRMKIGDLEKSLPKNFIRTHQSYIVNMDMIKKIGGSEISLYNGDKIPISRSKHQEVKENFLSYVSGTL